MSTKKYAHVLFIFDKCITTWNLKGYKGLSDHIGVAYQTLMAWKKRGSIGDYAPFMDKGISRAWLDTGEGQMMTVDSVKSPTTPYISESQQMPPDFAHDPELWQKYDEVEQAMWRKLFKNWEGMDEDQRFDYLREQIKNTKKGE
jgi:hypothetical protein